ncbi:hypothetical protein LXL04_034223 [Taraxacum kok-saghyz]
MEMQSITPKSRFQTRLSLPRCLRTSISASSSPVHARFLAAVILPKQIQDLLTSKMFYSHNLLARKGPLGTVWCAAHLQNKLKKSNYITVNIPSTVEQIMNPQVPIALRMSGHLLLGVVRIYSKKVEYLQHDYNVLRIDISKVYTNTDINLPKDANQAHFDSITLPERFDLDLMDVDDYDPLGSPDTHLRPHEDITLLESRDKIPSGYFMISFGEDTFSNPSLSGQESPCPRTPMSGPSQQMSPGFNDNNNNTLSPEMQRDAIHISPQGHIVFPEMVDPDPELQTPPHHSEPLIDNSEPDVMFDVAPTPLVEPEPAEQPRAKRRKIKYDEATVLSNKFMKKSLENPTRLLRKRKGAPCSSLDVWRVNNNRKKDKSQFDPIITGLCDNLGQLFDDARMSTRAHLVQVEKANLVQVEKAHLVQVEYQRENAGPSPTTYSPYSSPPRMDDYTPAMTTGSGSYPVVTTGVRSTPDPTSSTGSFSSNMETPVTFSEDHHGFDNNAALFDIPEGDDDDAGELSFIEEDGGSPISLKGTPQSNSTTGKQRSPPEIASLQTRTRAVAQYIKEKSTSSSTPSTPQNAGSVNLNTILERKTRKVCSRMFYETLVLKSCDLVDVKQDEPYGDIILKVTSKLAKYQFSH